MSCAAFIVSVCLYRMLRPMVLLMYLFSFICLHFCVNDVIEKKHSMVLLIWDQKYLRSI